MRRPIQTSFAAALFAALALLSVPAFAQPIYNWTGFYGGVHAGATSGSSTGGDSAPLIISPDITQQNSRGAFGGAQFGYQWQIGRMVWGTELAGSLGGVTGSENCFPNSVLSPGDSLSCRVKQDWSLQYLGRLGYAFGDGRFLPYITGGIALSSLNAEKHFDVPGILVGDWSARRIDYGMGFGGGFQYALGNGYFLGVEYLYLSYFNRDTSGVVTEICGCADVALSTQNLSTQSVRVSLNYTFGNPPPMDSNKQLSFGAASTTYDWTGFYVGGHAGYERATLNGATNAIPLEDVLKQTANGGLGGLQFGYNYQFGHVVLGSEFSATFNSADGSGLCFMTSDPLVGALDCGLEQKWSAQFLSRLGYALDDGRFMPYIVGGVAIAHTHFHLFAFDGFDTYDWGADKYMVGGIFGAGFQYAFGGGYSIGLEYLYTSYGTQDFSSLTKISGFPDFPSQVAGSMTSQSLRLNVNYQFGNPQFDRDKSAKQYNWTGFYAGLHAGAESGSAAGSDQYLLPLLSIGPNDLTKQSLGGGFGGGQIGYNLQFGKVVIGTELALSYANAGSTKDCFEVASFLLPSDLSCTLKQSWTGQYLNRLGFTDNGKLLTYIVGGVALTKVKAEHEISSLGSSQWGDSQVHLGGVFGAGFQYALTNNVLVGLEYLHTQYAAQQYGSNSSLLNLPAVFTQDLKTDAVRVVLNYKFDSTSFGH